MILDEG